MLKVFITDWLIYFGSNGNFEEVFYEFHKDKASLKDFFTL